MVIVFQRDGLVRHNYWLETLIEPNIPVLISKCQIFFIVKAVS